MHDAVEPEDERTQQIRALLPLVRVLAKRIARMIPHVDVDDLIGEGCVGAIRAVDTYDPTRGVPLRSYAKRVVAGAILNGVRSVDPVSERVRRTLRRADAKRMRLAGERGAMPTNAELEAGDPALRRARAAAARRIPISLESVTAKREGCEADPSADPASLLVERETLRALAAACDALPPRMRDLVRRHYWGDTPLRTVSRDLAVTPQRVSQLHLAALAKLRAQLGAP